MTRYWTVVERTRSSNFLPRRSISSSMLDYEGSSTELVGSSGAELRHNPLSFQLKTRLLRARARARERCVARQGFTHLCHYMVYT